MLNNKCIEEFKQWENGTNTVCILAFSRLTWIVILASIDITHSENLVLYYVFYCRPKLTKTLIWWLLFSAIGISKLQPDVENTVVSAVWVTALDLYNAN